MKGADTAGCMQDFIEQEGNIELQKKRQDETNERKNAVEAYVYMLRNQLSDALSGFVTEQEQSSISSKLTDTEVTTGLCKDAPGSDDSQQVLKHVLVARGNLYLTHTSLC